SGGHSRHGLPLHGAEPGADDDRPPGPPPPDRHRPRHHAAGVTPPRRRRRHMDPGARVPPRAWVVTFAGTAVNLCLGILYAGSLWNKGLIADGVHPPGSPMSGLNEGWTYLTDAQATWAYALCGFVFALCMIPGGRVQDRYGPRVGATLGGLFLAG